MEIFGVHICPHCIIQAIAVIKDDLMVALCYIKDVFKGVA